MRLSTEGWRYVGYTGLVVLTVCGMIGGVFLGEDVKQKRIAHDLAIENCKISCHPASAEWLPLTETCLCQVWSDPLTKGECEWENPNANKSD